MGNDINRREAFCVGTTKIAGVSVGVGMGGYIAADENQSRIFQDVENQRKEISVLDDKAWAHSLLKEMREEKTKKGDKSPITETSFRNYTKKKYSYLNADQVKSLVKEFNLVKDFSRKQFREHSDTVRQRLSHLNGPSNMHHQPSSARRGFNTVAYPMVGGVLTGACHAGAEELLRKIAQAPGNSSTEVEGFENTVDGDDSA